MHQLLSLESFVFNTAAAVGPMLHLIVRSSQNGISALGLILQSNGPGGLSLRADRLCVGLLWVKSWGF